MLLVPALCIVSIVLMVFLSNIQDDAVRAKYKIGQDYEFNSTHPSYLKIESATGEWFFSNNTHLTGSFVAVKPEGAIFLGSNIDNVGGKDIAINWQFSDGTGETWHYYGICLKNDLPQCLYNIYITDVVVIDGK